ncbi:MAG: DCC1-like thiol-disulfide oxidoreductase family protein [Nitrososphaeraceae archaeon]
MQAKSSSSKYILAYDADCGPCTRFMHVVDLLDKREKIDFISLTIADQQGLLDRISAPLRYKSFHLIFTNGEAKSGSEALLELITILPGGMIISPIINYFPGGKLIVRFIYNRFSRLHAMDSCHINNSDNNNNEYHTQ